MINLPPNVQTDILASTGTLFTDLWLFFAVVVGIPLAFYIIQRIIKLVPSDDGTTSGFSRWLYRRNRRLGAWYDRKTYKRWKEE